MAKIIVDGIELEAQPKQTIIQITDGINNGGVELTDIPRFCYHASLSVAGNCRMCLVEIGMMKKDKEGKVELDAAGKPTVAWIPKLTTACSTEIVDGMYVRTHKTSPVVAEAQKGVLEFILINHPLDCPICDQAGECPLQETTYKYGPEGSRFEFEKVHKPKRIEWGEKITFDAERCINCTRCVRFYDEYTKTSELEIVQRGWNNYPNPANPDALNDNPYAMNVIDLCPVGALTNTDYRFKSRVWEMSATDTISVSDARGNNIVLWVRDNIVLRITPRDNHLVNGFFIPDADRLNFKWLNENRANAPRLRESGKQRMANWQEAIEATARILKSYKPEEIFVMASAKACLETNYAAKKFATEVVGTKHLDFMRHFEGEDDHLLIRADKTPNAKGCELLGIEPDGISKDDLTEQIKLGKIRCVVVIEDEIEKLLSLDTLLKLDALIVLPYNNSEATANANVVLPAATFAEGIGSYVNFDGVVQRTRPAKMLKLQNRETMKEVALSRLDKHATQFDKWDSETNRIDARPSWEILVALSKHFSKPMSYESAQDIFKEITATVPAFGGLTYKKLGKQGVKLELVSGGNLTTA